MRSSDAGDPIPWVYSTFPGLLRTASTSDLTNPRGRGRGGGQWCRQFRGLDLDPLLQFPSTKQVGLTASLGHPQGCDPRSLRRERRNFLEASFNPASLLQERRVGLSFSSLKALTPPSPASWMAQHPQYWSLPRPPVPPLTVGAAPTDRSNLRTLVQPSSIGPAVPNGPAVAYPVRTSSVSPSRSHWTLVILRPPCAVESWSTPVQEVVGPRRCFPEHLAGGGQSSPSII